MSLIKDIIVKLGTDEKKLSTPNGVLLDFVYPVGSLYWTMNDNFNPNNSFGGTWQRIENKFVYARASDGSVSGTEGGSATQTLVINNLPSHSHGLSSGSISISGTEHSHLMTHKHSVTAIGDISLSENGGATFTGSTVNVNGNMKGKVTAEGTIKENGKAFSFRDATTSKGYTIFNLSGLETKDWKWSGNDPWCLDWAYYYNVKRAPHQYDYDGKHNHSFEGTEVDVTVSPEVTDGVASATVTCGGTISNASYKFTGSSVDTSECSSSTGSSSLSNISASISGDSASTGSGTSFSIMPPYTVANCWKRIG